MGRAMPDAGRTLKPGTESVSPHFRNGLTGAEIREVRQIIREEIAIRQTISDHSTETEDRIREVVREEIAKVGIAIAGNVSRETSMRTKQDGEE